MRSVCTLLVGFLILILCINASLESLKFSVPFAGGIILVSMVIILDLLNYMKQHITPMYMLENFSPIQTKCSDKTIKTVKTTPVEEKELTAKFIFIFADWCGHCQKTKPVWEKLQQKVKKIGNTKITYRLIDAEAPENSQIVDAYNVAAYPFIILVKPDGQKKVFSAKRTVDGFTTFLQKHLKLEKE